MYIHTYVQDELEGQGKGKVWGLLASADGNGRVCISVGYAKQQHIHIYMYNIEDTTVWLDQKIY